MNSLVILYAARLFVGVVLVVLALVFLSGCADASYWVGRTFYGVDCSPAVVQAHGGYCVYLNDKKEASHAEAARP